MLLNANSTPEKLNLKGHQFQDLFTVQGLEKLDRSFITYLKNRNPALHQPFLSYRSTEAWSAQQISQFIIDCSPHLEAFIVELFGIEEAALRLQAISLSHDPIFAFKKFYILREARRNLNRRAGEINFSDLQSWLDNKLVQYKIFSKDEELSVAQLGLKFLEEGDAAIEDRQKLMDWCIGAMTTPEGQEKVSEWISFKIPNKLNYENLIQIQIAENGSIGKLEGLTNHHREREGFQLTDQRMSLRAVQNETHYCVYCHEKSDDFCSKGFPVKKNDPSQGLKLNPLDEILTGCPLEEKISEMNFLKMQGFGIAALAVVMIDNPMCPATGHRICNDCMKGCIYQKQDPVNIPQIETRVLTDVLHLPWGVEIYDLLTRWNPLRREQFIPKSYNGLKILVMGMGPAGFTLAHHLLMEGFAVVGADGLKIEPLPKKYREEPIYNYKEIEESLDNRIMAGFGGVAEYGITVRWDKNFLKLIYITLMRRPYFQVFGSVRFGGTLKIEDAWKLGFDHVALAVGAGLPRELAIENSLAPGMRQANDFLMTLQLTGAGKSSSLANLEIRLPAVVIGGGLTGVDTATEVQAYYIAQVEKIKFRYEKLVHYYGREFVRKYFDEHSLIVLDEFLDHADQIKKERELALKENRTPHLNTLIRAWGGVVITYRRTMQESPAYRRNHEELANAFNEGIFYMEGLEPIAVLVDEWGYVSGLCCRSRIMDEEGNWMFSDEEQIIPARSLFVATGAKPNIAYEFEHRGTFKRDGFAYRRYEYVDDQLRSVENFGHPKTEHFGPFTSYEEGHKRVSFLGDTHPIFHGSVVKAIASAKRSYKNIADTLSSNIKKGDEKEYQLFYSTLQNGFQSSIISVKRQTDSIVELTVKAPFAAKNFSPGQFYRVQNYETKALQISDTRLQTEALALLGVVRFETPDHISFFVVENGASSRLVSTFQTGDLISVMGPTGAKSPLPSAASPQTFLFIGGVFAIAHVLSHGPQLKKLGHRVLFIGIFSSQEEIFCKKELESATDFIAWVFPEELNFSVREKDIVSTENIVSAIRNISQRIDNFLDIYYVMVIGASDLLREIQKARHQELKNIFNSQTKFLGSVYGPMQCMLKGVCAQCLQWQIDPSTGKRTKAVYACSWQNQPIEIIDIENLDERLGQNKTQEALTNLWLNYIFEQHTILKV